MNNNDIASRQTEIKQLLFSNSEFVEVLIDDIIQYGTMTEKVKLLQMILDRTVPKLQTVQMTIEEVKEQRQSLTTMFLKSMTDDSKQG